MPARLCGAVLAIALCGGAAGAAPLTLPFDFAQGEIGLSVSVNGAPLYMIVDTGVNPSAIDIARAEAVGLKVDHANGGDATGDGDEKAAKVFPTTITGLTIGGRDFAAIDALALDLQPLAKRYGKPLDGVLGYSFLTDNILLVDYPAHTLSLLDQAAEALPAIRGCRAHWAVPLKSFKDNTIPVIPAFRFGEAAAPISLDTGSNGGIALFPGAMELPGVRAALIDKGDTTYMGAHGQGHAKSYVLNAPVGFGPFSLPAGQIVSLYPAGGSADTRLANIGNPLFAQMKLKILFDYRSRLMTFYGDCR
jgi:hypothetical protein